MSNHFEKKNQTEKVNEYEEKNQSDTEQVLAKWNADTLGCSYRNQKNTILIFEALKLSEKKLPEIISMLGTPNKIFKIADSITHIRYYWGAHCSYEIRGDNLYPKKLIDSIEKCWAEIHFERLKGKSVMGHVCE